MEMSNRKIGLIITAALVAYLLIGNAALAFSTGTAESSQTNKPIKLTILHEGDFATPGEKYSSTYTRAAKTIEEKYPGVTVEVIQGTYQGSIDITLETMCASGNAPNVVPITVMRSSKFFKDGQALNLLEYIPDVVKKYEPYLLARVTKNGKVYALPGQNSPLGLNVNVSLAEQVGFKLPAPGDNWTIAQFMEFSDKLHAIGKYGAIVWAGSNPIPYVTCWWAGFGVEFFKNGDYTKLAIDSPNTRAALRWMKEMVTKGYSAPNPSQVVDDDMIAMWASGKVGAAAIFPDFLAEIDAKVKSGVLKEPFKTAWYPFPLALGVSNAGTFANYLAVVAMDKKDKRTNQISSEMAALCVDEYVLKLSLPIGSGISSIVNLPNVNKSRGMEQLADVVRRYGVYDMGAEYSKYPAFRSIIMPILAKYFDGKIDEDQFIKEYTQAGNEALK